MKGPQVSTGARRRGIDNSELLVKYYTDYCIVISYEYCIMYSTDTVLLTVLITILSIVLIITTLHSIVLYWNTIDCILRSSDRRCVSIFYKIT